MTTQVSNVLRDYNKAMAQRKAARDADRAAQRKARIVFQKQLAFARMLDEDRRWQEDRRTLRRARIVSLDDVFS